MRIFRTPEERFADLPGYSFAPHYLDWEGLRLHYVDEGAGEPVMLFHGEPSWSYLYRRMIPGLSAGARVIAPDLVGFGRSDKPTEIGWYTYDRHVEAMGAVITSLDLRGITAVVQDWGGPIGLRLAVEMPERFSRLVILNTAIASGRPPGEGFMRWRQFAERLGLDLPVGVVIRTGCKQEVADDVLAAYEAPFPERESRAGAAAFPLLVPLGADDPNAAPHLRVRAQLSAWTKPALVMFSDSDAIFPPSVARSMARLIPGAEEPVIVEGAAHFLQEDRGEVLTGHIREFLSRTAGAAASPRSADAEASLS